MSTGPKEAVYDAEIAAPMTQIIESCRRAGISMHASFVLDDDLACTTHLPPADGDESASATLFRERYNHIAVRAYAARRAGIADVLLAVVRPAGGAS